MIIHKNKGLCNKGDYFSDSNDKLHLCDIDPLDIHNAFVEQEKHPKNSHKWIVANYKLKELMTKALKWDGLR